MIRKENKIEVNASPPTQEYNVLVHLPVKIALTPPGHFTDAQIARDDSDSVMHSAGEYICISDKKGLAFWSRDGVRSTFGDLKFKPDVAMPVIQSAKEGKFHFAATRDGSMAAFYVSERVGSNMLIYAKTQTTDGNSIDWKNWSFSKNESYQVGFANQMQRSELEKSGYRQFVIGKQGYALNVNDRPKSIRISEISGDRVWAISDTLIEPQAYTTTSVPVPFVAAVNGKKELITVDFGEIEDGHPKVITRELLEMEGNIRTIALMPDNFGYAIGVETDSEQKIVVVERKSLLPVLEFPAGNMLLHTSPQGELFYFDPNSNLRRLTFDTSQIADEMLDHLIEDSDVFKQLYLARTVLEGVSWNPPTPALESETSMDPHERMLTEKLNEFLIPRISGCDNLDALYQVKEDIEALKSTEQYQPYSHAFDQIEITLLEKTENLQIQNLSTAVTNLYQQIAEADTVEEMLELFSAMAKIDKTRASMTFIDSNKRKSSNELLDSARERVDIVLREHDPRIVAEVDDRLRKATAVIEDTRSLEELAVIGMDENYKRLDRIIRLLLKGDLQAKTKNSLEDALHDRRVHFEGMLREQIDAENAFRTEIYEKTALLLPLILSSLPASVTNDETLSAWMGKSPLIRQYNELADRLEEKEGNSLKTQLSGVMQAQFHTKPQMETRVVQQGEEYIIDDVKFPVYRAPATTVTAHVQSFSRGDRKGQLYFMDSLRRKFFPAIEDVPLQTDHPETAKAIISHTADAVKHLQGLPREVPEHKPHWKMTPYIKGIMKKVMFRASQQMRRKQGFIILEGDAGTGKNVVVDIFAHHTNMEVFKFSCNANTDKQDMTFAFEVDEHGTYKVSSDLVEKLQTPGCIILLDELNTLPTGVSKMLNPLGDEDRSLNIPGIGKVRVHPDNLIFATQNTQNYLGVKPLPQELIGRSVKIEVDYPPLKNADGTFSYEEAFMMSDELREFQGVSEKDFETMWNYVVNNDLSNGGDRLITQELKYLIDQMHLVVETADKVRTAYRNFLTNASTDMVTFIFSLRETSNIANDMGYNADAAACMRELILPKVSDLQEKQRIADIIDEMEKPSTPTA